MKIKIICFLFFYTVQVDTVYQKVVYNSCLLLLLRHGIQKTKEHILFIHSALFVPFVIFATKCCKTTNY